MRTVRLLLVAAFLITGADPPSFAALSESDLQIAARALSFMENPPTGSVRVGIVYSPADPQSAAEAATLQQMLGHGLKAGPLVLLPELVKPAEAARTDVRLFLLTDGIGAAAAEVAAAARTKRIACVTTDIAQVRNGNCVMGVRSEPRIEILVNHAAAAASGIVFSTAFRMLITEF
jgi:hypothetical protein